MAQVNCVICEISLIDWSMDSYKTRSWVTVIHDMMTSSNGNIFRVTGPLCGDFAGHRWIPITKASDAELWCFLCCSSEQTVEWIINTSMIWDTIALIMTSMSLVKCMKGAVLLKNYIHMYNQLIPDVLTSQYSVSEGINERWWHHTDNLNVIWYVDGLMQERRNSTANALELRLSCTNPSM